MFVIPQTQGTSPGIQSKISQPVCSEPSHQDGKHSTSGKAITSGRLYDLHRLYICISSHPYPQALKTLPTLPLARPGFSIPHITFWSVSSPMVIHTTHETDSPMGMTARDPSCSLPGRLDPDGTIALTSPITNEPIDICSQSLGWKINMKNPN